MNLLWDELGYGSLEMSDFGEINIKTESIPSFQYEPNLPSPFFLSLKMPSNIYHQDPKLFPEEIYINNIN